MILIGYSKSGDRGWVVGGGCGRSLSRSDVEVGSSRKGHVLGMDEWVCSNVGEQYQCGLGEIGYIAL